MADGRDVYKALGGNVPIGLMGDDWGGEPIEPFMSADALADKTCGGTVSPEDHSGEDRSEVGGEMEGGGTIWNGMIAPLTQMRFANILWYQGES